MRLFTVAAALVGIGAAAAVLHAREARYPLPRASERLLYLRSPKVADRLVLDFDALAADVYWIRSIQSYGRDLKNRDLADRFALIDPLINLTTSLDPHFLIAYRFGAVFLALEPPNGPGRADLAIKLLEKGLVANPTNWQLAHDIGFVHYFHTGDFAAAAAWFTRAAAMPQAPEWLGPLAATTTAQGGNREDARRMLMELRKAPEDYIRHAAERTLAQLDALDTIDVLTGAVEAFNRTFGHYPSSWQEMVRQRVLRNVPVDQFSTPFVYDAATHRITLSPDSPLSPLPPTLQPR
jgi:tetratricopeptide (TPR) repeat protein